MMGGMALTILYAFVVKLAKAMSNVVIVSVVPCIANNALSIYINSFRYIEFWLVLDDFYLL